MLDDCFSYMACVSRCLEFLSVCKGMLLCKKNVHLHHLLLFYVWHLQTQSNRCLQRLNVLPGNETSCTTKEPLCEQDNYRNPLAHARRGLIRSTATKSNCFLWIQGLSTTNRHVVLCCKAQSSVTLSTMLAALSDTPARW